MKGLIFACAVLPLLASAAVCRYCSGTKYRTVSEVCEKCGGTGVYVRNLQRVSCPYCDRAKGLNRSLVRGDVVPSSGKVVRRVPCDKCSRPAVREIVITPAQLEALRDDGEVVLSGVRIVVRKAD